MNNWPSIVSTSILSALEGHYGNHHSTSRTQGSTLWINPLMAVYWCFRLESVAARVLYLEEVRGSRNQCELIQAIETFRDRLGPLRQRSIIPDASI